MQTFSCPYSITTIYIEFTLHLELQHKDDFKYVGGYAQVAGKYTILYKGFENPQILVFLGLWYWVTTALSDSELSGILIFAWLGCVIVASAPKANAAKENPWVPCLLGKFYFPLSMAVISETPGLLKNIYLLLSLTKHI